MPSIHESTHLSCPYAQASAYLERYLRDLAAIGGGAATLSIGVRGPAGVSIEKTVIAKFVYGLDEHHLKYIVAVCWEPEGGGPFPMFDGFLTVESEQPHESSRLSLDGQYEPPFGYVGKAIDAIAGREFARTTMRNLLARLRDTIERSFATSAS